jgi:hypothetical protein
MGTGGGPCHRRHRPRRPEPHRAQHLPHLALHLHVAAQVGFECKICNRFITFYFQAPRSWRCQRGFHWVNLHRPTFTNLSWSSSVTRRHRITEAMVWQRKLNSKAEIEGISSYSSFKRLVPGAFNVDFTGSTRTALPWTGGGPRLWRCRRHPRPRSAPGLPSGAYTRSHLRST